MSDRSRLRLFVLQLLVLALFVTLLSRLWFLQIMAGETFVAKQEFTARQTVQTAAARGRILDAQGRQLGSNLATYVISAQYFEFPRALPDNARNKKKNAVRAKVIKALSGLLQMDETQISDLTTLCEYTKDSAGRSTLKAGKKGVCWNGQPYQPIPIKRDVPERQAFLIEEYAEEFPGVNATLEPVRSYPYGELAAHVLGYIQPSGDAADAGQLVGRTGVELQYDKVLRGTTGGREFETNRAGVETREVSSTDPVPGSDLVLSIDLSVQKVVEDALASHIQRARTITDPCQDCDTAGQLLKAPAGAAVVLEAKTGRVAAMASYPTYDPSKFLKGIKKGSPDHVYLTDEKLVPTFSRAHQGRYAPGSTFKHVSTAAAVLDGHPLDRVYNCPGEWRIGNDPKPKHNYEGIGADGPITWKQTLVDSCDTVYYQIAEDDWTKDNNLLKDKQPAKESVQQMATRFGFGAKTGIDLPSEVSGVVPTRQWLREESARQRPTNCRLEKELPQGADGSAERRRWELVKDLCRNGSQWRPGDQANAAVGQGYVLASPLQLAVSYAALVNGGNVMVPKIAKGIIAPGGTKVDVIEPELRSKLDVDKKVLDYIKDALAAVPKEGTAKCAFGVPTATTDCKQINYAPFPFDELDIGGKTGTAEVLKKQDTSWFASFGPVSDPRYVVVVMIEEGGTGGTAAAPAAREIWEGIYGVGEKRPALENGALPTSLPVVAPDGTILAPGGKVTIRPSAGTSPSAGTGPSVGSSPSAGTSPSVPAGSSAPAVSLSLADLPSRRTGRVM
ncbi:MAG: penicillin-binding protein 2 [Mycobacteriales bacterium]